MATTTNFGWATPDDTDFVKDGAAAIRTLGSSIDTSLVDLQGGTTGQILAKTSATDMDFTWITNDVGDITEVAAGTGISGGGTSGSVTITNSMATAIDAKGDLIAGTGADTFDRLAVGTNNHVLTADSSTATGLKWAAPGGGKIINSVTTNATSTVSNASGTYADLISVTITPSAATSKIFLIFNGTFAIAATSEAYSKHRFINNGGTEIYLAGVGVERNDFVTSVNMAFLDSPASTSALTYKVQFAKNAGTTTTVSTGGQGYSLTAMEIAG